MKNLFNIISVTASIVVLSFLTSCGGSSTSSGGDSANGCVSTESVSSGINVTNTCSDTIIVVTKNERLVIPAGETHKLLNVSFFNTYASCYSPHEPQLDGNEYTCD